LLQYNADPRFHYFEQNGDQFALRRVDYEISTVKRILRHSAFIRYLWWNLQGGALRANLQRFFCRADDAQACSGETPAASEQRLQNSKNAVDHFLDQLPLKTKLESKSVVFVLDAMRPAMYFPEGLR